MARGIHVRYLGDDVCSIKGVGVFQKGTIAFAPSAIALELLAGKRFEAVAGGPTAQAFIVRIEQQDVPQAGQRVAPEEPADFERALEEEERRLVAEASDEPV